MQDFPEVEFVFHYDSLKVDFLCLLDQDGISSLSLVWGVAVLIGTISLVSKPDHLQQLLELSIVRLQDCLHDS